MEKAGGKIPNTKLFLIVLTILLFIYGYDFILLKGFEFQIATLLFKMREVLSAIIGIIHKKKFKEITIQTHLEDYFKKFK